MQRSVAACATLFPVAEKSNMLSICVVIAVRNEAQYLQVLLPLLAAQAIDVVIVDDESTDASYEVYTAFRGHPIIGLEYLPYRGYFSLSEQLQAKKQVYDKIKHDWIVHQDADEVLEHFKPDLTLRDAIQEADEGGYNVLNFEEFVFLPEPHADYRHKNYYTDILRYYFFEPQKNRLNRAWRRSANFDNILSGGHIVLGDCVSLCPVNHILRHYIVLGNEHAKRKYLHRAFSDEELSRGWHRRRTNFTEHHLTIPEKSSFLFRLDKYDSRAFRKDRPSHKHYWEWTQCIVCFCGSLLLLTDFAIR